MLNRLSITLIRSFALLFGSVCLLASLMLCAQIPEGALFLFITGCSWMGLSLMAKVPENPETPPSEGIGGTA